MPAELASLMLGFMSIVQPASEPSSECGLDFGLSDKMCVCYRRVAGLDVAFLDAD